MAHIRKLPARGPSIEWGPWSAAHFSNRNARDGFLSAVANNVADEWEAKSELDDDLAVWVRWRPGRFLRLNDLAVSHRGRIVFTVEPRQA
jgi:hypothetical protein